MLVLAGTQHVLAVVLVPQLDFELVLVPQQLLRDSCSMSELLDPNFSGKVFAGH